MKYLVLMGTLLLCTAFWGAETAIPADAKKPQTQTQAQSQPQSQPQTEVTVTYDVLFQGTYSGKKDPMQKIIQNKKDFDDLWKKHVSMLVPQPPVPDVDFDTQLLVAIFAGEKPTSGFQVLLKKVEAEGDNITVHFRLTEPPPNSLTLQVITQPFLILRMNKPKGQVQLVQDSTASTQK